MSSLKSLVQKQGVTVLSVIHQPRKVIFDSFDSLVLLGVGGNLVFHGPVNSAEAYFGSIPRPYQLPTGESLADWLIDISTGMIAPNEQTSVSTGGPTRSTLDLSLSRRRLIEGDGPSAAKEEDQNEVAANRREKLYRYWKEYMKGLNDEQLAHSSPPTPFPFPEASTMPPFPEQLKIQLERNFLLAWRNRSSKIADACIVVFAVTLVSVFEGTLETTRNYVPEVFFDDLTSGDPVSLVVMLPEVFGYALNLSTNVQYAMKVGVLAAVLIGLTASKAITAKRLEFFRESGSGISVNAYFAAINIFGLLEYSFQMLLAGSVASWLRSSLASWYSYVFNFWLMMWLTVSWALLLSIVTPPSSAAIAVALHVAFFGLLCSGGLSPVTFDSRFTTIRVPHQHTKLSCSLSLSRFLKNYTTKKTLCWAFSVALLV
eukprot:scaffold4510_cov183-Amphora_coffeaeformis.AAC.99